MMASLPNELWWNIIAHAISLEGNLAMVKPSVEHLHPFFPGRFPGFSDKELYYSQSAIWKCSIMLAHNFVQVNRLWRGIAERFLYSAFYVEEKWRVQRFIDTIKLNPNLAKQLRTLVIIPRLYTRDHRNAANYQLILQMLSLCHHIDAIVVDSEMNSRLLHLFQSPDSSRCLVMLSALWLSVNEFATFMTNLNNYARLQVLELSVTNFNLHPFPSLPEHITFPSLRTLILQYLDPRIINVVGKWELPSLKELSIPRWDPPISIALLPLIQRSYERLEFFGACVGLLHDPAFHDTIRAPPCHLRNVTLNIPAPGWSSPPIHPAIKLLFSHVVTLGISQFGWIKSADQAGWVQFFSDTTYMPHLRSVLTYVQAHWLYTACAFEKVFKDRGVAFKGVTNDSPTFVPIRLLEGYTLEVSMSPFSSGSVLISSPALRCSPWELGAMSNQNCPYSGFMVLFQGGLKVTSNHRGLCTIFGCQSEEECGGARRSSMATLQANINLVELQLEPRRMFWYKNSVASAAHCLQTSCNCHFMGVSGNRAQK